MYQVYILYSPKLDKYYVGSTQNIEIRINRHNAGHGNFTKKGIPWKLVYKEDHETRTLAVNREKYIKNKKSRMYIEELINTPRIETENPKQ